jgi:hypothetical protein
MAVLRRQAEVDVESFKEPGVTAHGPGTSVTLTGWIASNHCFSTKAEYLSQGSLFRTGPGSAAPAPPSDRAGHPDPTLPRQLRLDLVAAKRLPTSTQDADRYQTCKVSHAGLNVANRPPAGRADLSCRYALDLQNVESNWQGCGGRDRP